MYNSWGLNWCVRVCVCVMDTGLSWAGPGFEAAWRQGWSAKVPDRPPEPQHPVGPFLTFRSQWVWHWDRHWSTHRIVSSATKICGFTIQHRAHMGKRVDRIRGNKISFIRIIRIHPLYKWWVSIGHFQAHIVHSSQPLVCLTLLPRVPFLFPRRSSFFCVLYKLKSLS